MFVLDWEQPRCDTCRWWMDDGTSAECHRYPPNPEQFRPNPNGYGLDWIVASWPETKAKDFCGEHQSIPTVDGGAGHVLASPQESGSKKPVR